MIDHASPESAGAPDAEMLKALNTRAAALVAAVKRLVILIVAAMLIGGGAAFWLYLWRPEATRMVAKGLLALASIAASFPILLLVALLLFRQEFITLVGRIRSVQIEKDKISVALEEAKEAKREAREATDKARLTERALTVALSRRRSVRMPPAERVRSAVPAPGKPVPEIVEKLVEEAEARSEKGDQDAIHSLFLDENATFVETNPDDRVVSATVSPRPVAGPYFEVCVRLDAGSSKPLRDDVYFVLHTSFEEQMVQPGKLDKSGMVATTVQWSYGAFVLAVVADEGKTILKYDLVQAKGASYEFINETYMKPDALG